MKRLYTILLTLMCFCTVAAAQNISVVSIQEAPNDLQARTNPKRDLNGELCALIKVALPSVDDLDFSGNIVGTVVYRGGVYSIYVPAGTKRISFSNDRFYPGEIDFSSANISVKSGVTYNVILRQIAEHADMRQSAPASPAAAKTASPGKDFVDLGLSVLWASANIGADAEYEAGEYYAWAEKDAKELYNWSTYKHSNGSATKLNKYCTSAMFGTVDGIQFLEPADDVARNAYDLESRTPSDEDWNELISECEWIWTDNYASNGVPGYIVSGQKDGYKENSIFLPAVGYYSDKEIGGGDSNGGYWSTSIHTKNPGSAVMLYLNAQGYGNKFSNRCYGRSVRAVSPVKLYHSIRLDQSALNVNPDTDFTLSYTIDASENADKTVVWSSSIPSVVSVEGGVLRSHAPGVAIITAKIPNGPSTKCRVTVSEFAVPSAPANNSVEVKSVPKAATSGSVTSPEFVDLGCSVMWASCNLGAEDPYQVGDYFAWGETEPKADYLWSNYMYNPGGSANGTGINKYTYKDSNYNGAWYSGKRFVGDGKDVLDASDDAASVALGSGWRLPTIDEWKELTNKCLWEWVEDYNNTGVSGYVISGKSGFRRNNFIFLPAAGSYKDSNLIGIAENCIYSSSDLAHTRSNSAMVYWSSKGGPHHFTANPRYVGIVIRPVYVK